MADIVNQLQCIYDPDGCGQCTFCLAKAEIERLRAALAELDALCDQLALALTTAAANEIEFADDCWATINAALAAYDKHKEARRG